MRMFWEKADVNDNDAFHAFRKRTKEKMNLRRKTKLEINHYQKMYEMRHQSMMVIDILNKLIDREHIKKNLIIIEQKEWEVKAE